MFSKNPLINLFRYAWHYSFDRKKLLVLSLCFTTIGNIVWLFQPIVIGRVFNSIQFAERENQLVTIGYSLILLILLYVIGWIFHGISRVIENNNAFLIRKNYRQVMFEKVMDLPTKWHKDHHSGDTIDKVNKASDFLYDFCGGIFRINENITGLIVSIIILALYDLKPIIIVVFSSIVAVIAIIKYDRKLLRNYQQINKAENFIAAGIYDYISNYITIISLRLKKRAAKEIESRSMKHFPTVVNTNKINEAKWFTSGLIISIMTSIVIFLNAYSSYKTQGIIVIGTLFILYQYLSRIGDSFYTFAWKYSDTVRQNAAIVAAEAISDEFNKLHLAKKYSLPENWQNIKIKKLFFTYMGDPEEKEKKSVLEDISMEMKRKEKIALIGVSGSGKSTLLSLLRGLHEADSVQVHCDGKKMINGLKYLFQYTTLIPQEPEIFNNTIRYNITLGVDVEKDRLQKVIRLAKLETLISRLEKGLETSVLEKGVSLSGGEKQRLALARGLLAAEDSQILLLDEPTSSVDIENELWIYQNIFNAFREKVIISAIHSLHLLKYFDYIYLFKESKIIAEGDFATMFQNDDFKVLWNNYNMEEDNVLRSV